MLLLYFFVKDVIPDRYRRECIIPLNRQRESAFRCFWWNISAAPFDKLRVTVTQRVEEMVELFFSHRSFAMLTL